MRRPFHHRPSPALIVASVALAVALGGTSYAAIVLPANSVGAKQLRKNAVTNKKIAKGAVTGAKVKDDSLTGVDILESSLGKVPSATSADGAINATNATTATNATNASALSGYVANGLTRVARMSTQNSTTIPFDPAPVFYGTALSITAPAAGFVVINASISVRNSPTTPCTTSCVWWSWIRHFQDGTNSTSIVSDTNDQFSATSASYVFPVNAGVNTFGILLTRSTAGGANGTLQGWFAEMNAIYSPFGSTGGSTLGSTQAIGDRER